MSECRKDSESLLAALSRMEAFRRNMAGTEIIESYVNEYHDMLDCVQKFNIEMGKFRIPDNMLKREIGAYNAVTKKAITYRADRSVEHNYFLAKLDGAILFLNRLLKMPDRTIGFESPD